MYRNLPSRSGEKNSSVEKNNRWNVTRTRMQNEILEQCKVAYVNSKKKKKLALL